MGLEGIGIRREQLVGGIVMSTTLALFVVWTIVALVCYCCYRLWYWTPTPITQTVELPADDAPPTRRAA